ncbi:hypothetical protein BJ508DRAFT_130614 [Ascobolus immersus RN42]|uniref:Uncharacterized protein n=1 Tax=Ascobolus immersus RN42 TaxID=1160509 RepID=A0A3N4I7R8_ASCIM|nr:hypothetical protein BJ508DRAFT_130614 [Ascobolus immersus RN42]
MVLIVSCHLPLLSRLPGQGYSESPNLQKWLVQSVMPKGSCRNEVLRELFGSISTKVCATYRQIRVWCNTCEAHSKSEPIRNGTNPEISKPMIPNRSTSARI